MSNRVVNVHIDRIVLSGLDIAPGRAESLRSSIGLEVQRVLAKREAEGLTGGAISHISIPAVKAADLQSEGQIAGNIARNVSHVIRGLG